MRKIKKFCMFSKEQDELLIELVSHNPVLYDPSNPSYKDIVLRDRTWTEIGSVIDRSAEDCKTRWRSIRDLYHKKKKGGKGGLWCTETNTLKWNYAEQMAFMDDYFVDRKPVKRLANDAEDSTNHSDQTLKCENIEEQLADEIEEEEVEISPDLSENPHLSGSRKRHFAYMGPISIPTRKFHKTDDRIFNMIKKKSEERSELIREVLSSIKKDENPIKTFFSSMALTVMQFPPLVQAEAKLKVCQVITEIESRLAADSLLPNQFKQK